MEFANIICLKVPDMYTIFLQKFSVERDMNNLLSYGQEGIFCEQHPPKYGASLRRALSVVAIKAGACEGSEQSIDYRGRRRRTLNLRENKRARGRATRQWIDMNKHLPAACMK